MATDPAGTTGRGRGPTRHTLQWARQPHEIGEAGREPHHGGGQRPRGELLHHVVGPAAGERSHLLEIGSVEPTRDGEDSARADPLIGAAASRHLATCCVYDGLERRQFQVGIGGVDHDGRRATHHLGFAGQQRRQAARQLPRRHRVGDPDQYGTVTEAPHRPDGDGGVMHAPVLAP